MSVRDVDEMIASLTRQHEEDVLALDAARTERDAALNREKAAIWERQEAQTERDAANEERDVAKVEAAGAEHRAKLVLAAKDAWAERTRVAEAERDAAVGLLRAWVRLEPAGYVRVASMTCSPKRRALP